MEKKYASVLESTEKCRGDSAVTAAKRYIVYPSASREDVLALPQNDNSNIDGCGCSSAKVSCTIGFEQKTLLQEVDR